MRLDARVEGLDEAMRAIDDVHKRHAPFAGATAINRTLEEGMAATRDLMQRNMILRAPSFVLPPVQLPRVARATKTKLHAQAAFGYADIGQDSIGARREKLFRKFQQGGFKTAEDPQFPIAIPTKALRPTPAALVPRAMYPVNLRLVPRLDAGGQIMPLRRGKVRTLGGAAIGKRARKQQGLVGIGGTFVMYGADGRALGIFQRTGRGARDYRMIWAYRMRIRIPARLPFFELMANVVNTRLLINFHGAMEMAIRTAR